MAQRKMREVRPSSDFAEQSRIRRRQSAKLYDFNDLVDGKRKRKKAKYCQRDDGEPLFYHGKENAIYGETESGKDMLLCLTVFQCMEKWDRVAWIDFEEGDEIETGSRLLDMGVEPDQLVDQDLFRFSTPENVEEARNSIHDAGVNKCDLIIFNGIQAMYGLFGWELYDPSSPAMFRVMISPLLKAGRTVIETDHMTKSSAEGKNGGSRYAAGGIAKLNWINGAAYLLEAIDPIVIGSVGRSRILLTKDRPGSVKRECQKIKGEPRMMNAGMLVVKSTTNGKNRNDDDDDDAAPDTSLNISIENPVPGSVIRERSQERESQDKTVPDEVIEKVLSLYERLGKNGASKRAIEGMYQGHGASKVRVAIDILVAHGCLVKAGPSKTSNMAQLKYAKDWDPKMKISNDD